MALRKYFVTTAGTMLLAAAMITWLVYDYNKKWRAVNGFNRTMPIPKAMLINAAPIPAGVRSIAGIATANFYLETDTANKLICMPYDLSCFKETIIAATVTDSLQSLFKIIVDSPSVIIAAGNIPAVIETGLTDSVAVMNRFPAHTFTRLAVTGQKDYVMRMFDKTGGKWEQVFVKGPTSSGILYKEKNLSVQKGDAGFSTDGLLHYDASTGLMLYCYFYENSILCFDSLLQLKYRVPTIDTVAGNAMMAGTVAEGNDKVITNTSPVRDLHYQSCTSKGRLYINSRVKADNETASDFRINSVIDVYEVINGDYLRSFYVPGYKDEYLQDFLIRDSIILVLYNDFIAKYKLPYQ